MEAALREVCVEDSRIDSLCGHVPPVTPFVGRVLVVCVGNHTLPLPSGLILTFLRLHRVTQVMFSHGVSTLLVKDRN